MDHLLNGIDTYSSPDGKDTISVGKLCYQTAPCQHRVTVNGQVVGLIYATEILALFQKHKIPVPVHFQSYIGFPRRN